MIDKFGVKGDVYLSLFDENGKLKEERKINNLVVTTGKNWIADRMKQGTASVMTHIAVGTGTNAAAAGDTTLQTELTRQAVDTSGGVLLNNTLTFTTTLAAGTGTGAITEAGILNNSSGGTLLARTVFSVINKAAGDSLAITWVVTVG